MNSPTRATRDLSSTSAPRRPVRPAAPAPFIGLPPAYYRPALVRVPTARPQKGLASIAMGSSVAALCAAVLVLWAVGQSRLRVSGPAVSQSVSHSASVFGLAWDHAAPR